jgi:hypothetical protein
MNIHTEGQTDKQTVQQTERMKNAQTYKRTEDQKNKQTDGPRRKDGQTGRQTDRQRDRQRIIYLNSQANGSLMKLVVWRVAWRGRVLVDAAVHLVHAAAVKAFDGRTVVERKVAGSLSRITMYTT